VWRYLRDPTFSCFDTIVECVRHTHTRTHTDRQDTRRRHRPTALSIASRGKNELEVMERGAKGHRPRPERPSRVGFLGSGCPYPPNKGSMGTL